MNEPGTSPPNVHAAYCTLSASRSVFSTTSRFTITLVGCVRVIGGGTLGACVSTATSCPLTSSLGWRSWMIFRPSSSRADASLHAWTASGIPMRSAAPTRAVRQPSRRDLSATSSGDIEGLRSVVDGMGSDAAFEQVRDRGVEERQTSRAGDCLPRVVRTTRTGGIARSVAEHAARIERHGIEQVDDAAKRDLPGGHSEGEPARRAARARDESGLRHRVEHLRHVVARRTGGVRYFIGAERAGSLRPGNQEHGAERVVGGERYHFSLRRLFASFSSAYEYLARNGSRPSDNP